MTQKMIVIPYEKYNNLKSKLEVYEKSTPTDIIPVIEDNILKTDSDAVLPTNQNEDEKNLLTESDIIEYFPKTYHRRCRLLLRHMKDNSMSWDSQGRLILNKEECITNGHIVDLISYAICNYIRRCNSEVGKHFTKLLIGTHCPLTILNTRES